MNIPFFDKYPADVLILQKRGHDGGLLGFRDKARFRRKGLDEFYELKKRHKKMKPPNYSYMIPQTNGRPMVVLFEYARDMFAAVDPYHLELIPERDKNGDVVMEDFTDDGGIIKQRPKIVKVVNLKAADEDMSQWASVARRQAEDKYRKKSFMDKYGTMIMFFMFFVFGIALFYMLSGAMSDSSMNVVQAVNNLANKISPGIVPG
jgi:hypothetical protein